MIPVSVPSVSTGEGLISCLLEIVRRAIDGTVLPLFVDNTNQRVLIGATSATTSNIGKLEVTGDIKVIGGGSGIIISNRAGTAYYRLVVDNDGALSVDPI